MKRLLCSLAAGLLLALAGCGGGDDDDAGDDSSGEIHSVLRGFSFGYTGFVRAIS